MKGSTQAGLVLAVGYVLGRRRKLRTATVMAAAAATGGAGSLGSAALRRGLKMLGSSEALGDLGPQVSKLGETVRGDLAEAGKAALLASVTNRMSSLSDSLQDRAESVRNPAAGAAGQAEDGAGDLRQRARRKPRHEEPGTGDGEPEDEYETDEDQDEYQADEDEDQPRAENGMSPARRRAGRRSPVSRTRR